jgi:hypothetical protein
MPEVLLIPSARRLIKSLRDMGYDFAQAVADVVDNSVEAHAKTVAIDIEFDGDDSWVRITDDGKGMRPEELREALRYGAERKYEEEDLGKFGLGLKTASMSQCQRLSVASRWNKARADVTAYAWDLDHIEKTNRWEILPVVRSGKGPSICEPLKDSPGTVVLWQRLDRILGYKLPYGEMARKRLSQMCRDVEQHLGMVFHRFLTGEQGRKRFRLLVNGNKVKAWDPFCISEPKTKVLKEIRLNVSHEGKEGEIVIQPYILPRQEDFSSPEAFRAASGTSGWNQQQGFYIYRAGRLVQSGGWSHLRAPDEHTKLARIAISFKPVLDDAFKINVAKMRVQLPVQKKEEIQEAIAPVVKLAREIYDKKMNRSPHFHLGSSKTSPGEKKGQQQLLDGQSTENRKTSSSEKGLGSALFSFEEWSSKTLSVSKKEEKGVVKAVLKRLRNQL